MTTPFLIFSIPATSSSTPSLPLPVSWKLNKQGLYVSSAAPPLCTCRDIYIVVSNRVRRPYKTGVRTISSVRSSEAFLSFFLPFKLKGGRSVPLIPSFLNSFFHSSIDPGACFPLTSHYLPSSARYLTRIPCLRSVYPSMLYSVSATRTNRECVRLCI